MTSRVDTSWTTAEILATTRTGVHSTRRVKQQMGRRGWTTHAGRLYRIAAAGSEKAVLLSGFDDTASFGMPLRRETPSANP